MTEVGDDRSGWSLSTFSGWETLFDRLLKVSEVVIVLTISIALVLFAVREVLWIWFASDPAMREARIEALIKTMNDNWKVGLLLLVPLFYRTIRTFLERVRKAFGMEARLPEDIEEKPNPPQLQAPEAEV